MKDLAIKVWIIIILAVIALALIKFMLMVALFLAQWLL